MSCSGLLCRWKENLRGAYEEMMALRDGGLSTICATDHRLLPLHTRVVSSARSGTRPPGHSLPTRLPLPSFDQLGRIQHRVCVGTGRSVMNLRDMKVYCMRGLGEYVDMCTLANFPRVSSLTCALFCVLLRLVWLPSTKCVYKLS